MLLKNDDSTLPLSKDDFTSTSSLALVGPQSDDWRVLLGAVNYAVRHESWVMRDESWVMSHE